MQDVTPSSDIGPKQTQSYLIQYSNTAKYHMLEYKFDELLKGLFA